MKNSILILYMPSQEEKALPLPPLGISVLAGYLKSKGIEVRIDDLDIKTTHSQDGPAGIFSKEWIMNRVFPACDNPVGISFNVKEASNYLETGRCEHELEGVFDKWRIDIDAEKFSHVGFSVMSINQLFISLSFAKYLKSKYGVKIIIGGSFIKEKMSVLLESQPFIDYLIVGEGEIPLSRLLKGDRESEIGNLIFKSGPDIIVNEISEEYAESMEPDFDGLPFDLYRQNSMLVMPFELTKGCVNRCAFCSSRKKIFLKDITQVVNEIKKIKELYNTRCFIFIDNAINISKKFCVELCSYFIKNKLDILWSAYYISKNESADYFKLLSDAGCIQLRYGLETASKRALADMNKNIDIDTIPDALLKSRMAGIWNHLLFMTGYPGEAIGDYIDTVEFIRKNRRNITSASVIPFDLARIDLAGRRPNAYGGHYPNGRLIDTELMGLKYRIFKDRHIKLKLKSLTGILRYNGVKFVGYLSEGKKDIEKSHFLFNAFYRKLIR